MTHKLIIEINFEDKSELEDLLSYLNDTFYDMYNYKIVNVSKGFKKIVREYQ